MKSLVNSSLLEGEDAYEDREYDFLPEYDAEEEEEEEMEK